MSDLEQKLRDKSAMIAVVGLGYVGLPLAVSFASAGLKVLGIDIQQKRVDRVNNGEPYITDVTAQHLEKVTSSGLLTATTDHSRLAEASAICVCVPTPLTRAREPDLSHVVYESEQISRSLKRGQLVVLESTTCLGTTREIMLPILERSGLKAGTDFYLAYSPERIDLGGATYGIYNIPKIVGGIGPESSRLASLLYRQVTGKVIIVSSTETAEMTKVFENVFRNVNIALVNELAQLCEKMDISVWEVIRAASTKPFGYMPFYPGIGTGGHNTPVDPYYLASKAREYDFHTRFIQLAAEINEYMPYHVASRIMDALNDHKKSINKSKILVLGVAYKKDVADIRGSPSLKLISVLQKMGAAVSYHDPHIAQVRLPSGIQSSIELNNGSLESFDCTVFATAHSCYDIKKIVSASKLVFDARGVTRHINRDNIVRLGE